ncbi:MAG: dihydrofolate reductase [Deltaproteobacteria bacterium]|nr:dihydrofolate reductase [Deltaproteobacteria bacterium]
MLSIIVAISQNGVIGLNNRLPWHLPEDLKHFKETTMGHTIIMGENTFKSLGRPLPGRKNIVLTDQHDYHPEGTEVIHSFEELIRLGKGDAEVFVIGGAMVYRQALPHADRLYLTHINRAFEGDTFFPAIDLKKEFEIIKQSAVLTSKKDNLPYQFVVAGRRIIYS